MPAGAGGGGGRQPEPGLGQPFCPLPCGPPTDPPPPRPELRAKDPKKGAPPSWALGKPRSHPGAPGPRKVFGGSEEGWCGLPP